MRNFIYLIFILCFSISCSKTQNEPVDNTSSMDKLFISGFDMTLDQIYVMNMKQTIPYLDTPSDSCFKSSSNTVTINNFVVIGNLDTSNIANPDTYLSDERDWIKVLTGLTRGEVWTIGKIQTRYDTTYVEHGYGSDYFITMHIAPRHFTIIKCINQYTTREYVVSIKIGDLYVQRGHDNHVFNVNYIDSTTNSASRTNLYFEVLTKGGYGLFNNNKTIYFDTNLIAQVAYQMTAPLTGSQVQVEINKGNYKLYLWNKLTTYRIGDNLYIPRYNSYIYIGCINTNGAVISLKTTYYRFKFSIR